MEYFGVIGSLVKAILDLVQDAVKEGKVDAQTLRDKPVSIAISFGGGEGEVAKVQKEIYLDLPDD